MPKLVYGQSSTGIEVPAGRYNVKFVGTEDRDPIQESKFGNEGAPRMAWVFEVQDGSHKGAKIAQESGCKATARSTAARIILGLAGGNVAVGKTVDTDQFIGKPYVLKVGPNPNSDKGNLYVADLEPVGATPTAAPARANGTVGPPPRKPAAALAPTVDNRKFWFQVPGASDATLETFKDIQDHLTMAQLEPAEVEVCPEGGNEWVSAASVGFTREIAF